MTSYNNSQLAVITGAASGIGRALATEAGKRGLAVLLADVNEAGLEETAAELRAVNGDVTTQITDVSRAADLQALADTAFSSGKTVTLVFANAGIMRVSKIWELAPEQWSLLVDINIKGVAYTMTSFIARLIEQGSASRFLITGSTSSFLPRTEVSAYSVSKHALWGMAESAELELRKIEAPVRMGFIAPSGVKTPIAATDDAALASDDQAAVNELIEAFGMEPAELARQCFDAIAAEKFWILPEPSFKDALIQRAERVNQEQSPQ